MYGSSSKSTLGTKQGVIPRAGRLLVPQPNNITLSDPGATNMIISIPLQCETDLKEAYKLMMRQSKKSSFDQYRQTAITIKQEYPEAMPQLQSLVNGHQHQAAEGVANGYAKAKEAEQRLETARKNAEKEKEETDMVEEWQQIIQAIKMEYGGYVKLYGKFRSAEDQTSSVLRLLKPGR